MAQVDDLKNYREMYGNTKRVSLVKDKLMVGSQVVMDSFEHNKLPALPNLSPPSLKTINEEVKGSLFKGFSANINSVRGTAEKRDALFQSHNVARAHHTFCAYVVTNDSGMRISGYSDDGEWSASKILQDKLLENKVENTSGNIHDGQNLGKL